MNYRMGDFGESVSQTQSQGMSPETKNRIIIWGTIFAAVIVTGLLLDKEKYKNLPEPERDEWDDFSWE